ncbi:MAG: histidine--tRNA ligase family protein [Chloroflexi bacterium]|nr:histidine--tRNA ligase family protein [Chloroflexota bacterium]
MDQPRIEHLVGMRDLSEAELLALRRTQEALGGFLAAHGYRLVETPILEPTELFLRKSGGALAARLYSFVEPGGHRVSLRPEFTAPVLRRVMQGGLAGPMPLRVQYAGPVFRYDPDGKSAYRQFAQVGAELLGAGGPRADAEVIALTCRSLTAQGLTGLSLVLGDVGALARLLGQYGVTERGQVFLLSAMAELRQGGPGLAEVRRQAETMGLLGPRHYPPGLAGVGEKLGEQEAADLLRGLLTEAGREPLGSRSPTEIMDRFLRKLRASGKAERVEEAITFMAAVGQLRGEPAETLARARRVAQEHGLDPSPFTSLADVLETLDFHDLDGTAVTLDFGLARDIAYYTGVTFEVTCAQRGQQLVLGGGGRYDGLAKALGAAQDVPAIGFAITLENVLSSLGAGGGNSLQGRRPARVMLLPLSAKAYGPALKVAEALRLSGEIAEVALTEMTVKDALKAAPARGLDAIVTVDEGGNAERHWVRGAQGAS